MKPGKGLQGDGAVCDQAAAPGHGAESQAVEPSADPPGDLLPPPTERPELLSGGERRHGVVKGKSSAVIQSEGLMGQS